MNKLSSKHFIFFIFSTIMIAIRSYSSIFIRLGGRDTWIISFGAFLCIFLYFIYLLKICISTNTFDIDTIFLSNSPKVLSYIMLLFFALGLFLVSVEASTTFSSSIHTNFFLKTPTWYCLLFMLVPSTYIILRKFNTLLIVVIVVTSISILGDLLFLLLIVRYLDFSYLFPIMKDAFTLDSLRCFSLILGSLSSVMIAVPFLKFLSKPNKLIKHSSLGLLASGFFVVSSFVSVISFFGPFRSGNIFYPEFVQSQRIQIMNFIEFGELFYIFRNVCMWLLKYILATYGILILFKDSIKNKTTFVIIYNIFVFIISVLITRDQYFFFGLLNYLEYINVLTFILIPFISFSLYKIKFKKAQN